MGDSFKAIADEERETIHQTQLRLLTRNNPEKVLYKLQEMSQDLEMLDEADLSLKRSEHQAIEDCKDAIILILNGELV